jgi:hypothetical protein
MGGIFLIMNYSKSHHNFNHHLGGDYPVLSQPEDFLGPNYEAVLNFWWYIDTLTDQQIDKLGGCYFSCDEYVRQNAWNISRDFATTAVGHSNRVATYVSTEIIPIARYEYRNTHNGAYVCAKLAAYELISMDILLEQGLKLFFVPMFENL